MIYPRPGTGTCPALIGGQTRKVNIGDPYCGCTGRYVFEGQGYCKVHFPPIARLRHKIHELIGQNRERQRRGNLPRYIGQEIRSLEDQINIIRRRLEEGERDAIRQIENIKKGKQDG